jgi:hypothetical protein
VHYGNAYNNAFWDDVCFCMTYGDGNGGATFTMLASLDTAGHEMTHGVTSSTANLIYSEESGGLNESTSDIFGAMVEFYTRGAAGVGNHIPDTGGTWTMGEQISATKKRYLYKPSLDGRSPDAWSDTMYKLDVHYSSGPMNRAFYFLSQGASASSGSATYSTYLPVGMTGIGNDKAARIWYRALTTYLTPSSNYLNARSAALKAAIDLYGASSAENVAVRKAFGAINVGNPNDNSDDFTAPTISVSESGAFGNISLLATAADNRGVSRVDYFIDSVIAGSATGSPFTLKVDSTQFANGTHQLSAKAYDAAGSHHRIERRLYAQQFDPAIAEKSRL